MVRLTDPEGIERRIGALAQLPIDELRAQWTELYRQSPPNLSRQLLVRSNAYRLQEQAFGGLKPATRKRLLAIAAGADSLQTTAPPIKPGTRLIRDWHGETHEVVVFDKGFHWRGGTYGSLSAIARKITGTRWNGHVFFGLKKAAP